MNTNQRKYVEFIKAKFPALYARAMAEVARQQRVAGIGELSGFLDTFTQAVEKLTPVVVQAKAQKDLLKVQMDRARQNLPPLEASQYAPAMRVEVQPSVGLSPMAKAAAWVGAGLLGLALLRKVVKG